MRRSFVLLAALVAGCSSIDHHQRVDGWPALEIVEHHVPHAEMRDRCSRYVSFGASPEACAEFDLVARKCHIWYSAEFPPQRFIVQHERLHCAGYDHIGSTGMEQHLKQYLAGPGATGAATGSSR
jgi:hypothetical protein